MQVILQLIDLLEHLILNLIEILSTLSFLISLLILHNSKLINQLRPSLLSREQFLLQRTELGIFFSLQHTINLPQLLVHLIHHSLLEILSIINLIHLPLKTLLLIMLIQRQLFPRFISLSIQLFLNLLKLIVIHPLALLNQLEISKSLAMPTRDLISVRLAQVLLLLFRVHLVRVGQLVLGV